MVLWKKFAEMALYHYWIPVRSGISGKGILKYIGGIDFIDGSIVHFSDGEMEHFNAIIAGIGYYRDYANFVEVDDSSRFEDLKVSTSQTEIISVKMDCISAVTG